MAVESSAPKGVAPNGSGRAPTTVAARGFVADTASVNSPSTSGGTWKPDGPTVARSWTAWPVSPNIPVTVEEVLLVSVTVPLKTEPIGTWGPGADMAG